MKISITVKNRVTAGLLAGLLFAVSVSGTTRAANPTEESITMTPVNIRMSIDAGTEKTSKFSIFNDGEVSYDFKVYASPYYVKDSSYTTDFATERVNADAYKWVKFEKDSYFAEAHKVVVVNFTITAPKNAAPGGHYGILFAETQAPNESEEGTSLRRNKRVGAPLFLNVNGQYSMGGVMSEINTPLLQTAPPLSSTFRVTNTGNSDFMTDTSYEIQDIFGNRKYFKKQEFVVFPETTRDFTLKWENSPTYGLYRVNTVVKFLDQEKQASTIVLIAPIWVYVMVLLAVAATLYYLILGRKYRRTYKAR